MFIKYIYLFTLPALHIILCKYINIQILNIQIFVFMHFVKKSDLFLESYCLDLALTFPFFRSISNNIKKVC